VEKTGGSKCNLQVKVKLFLVPKHPGVKA